jgi:uncharacterized protein (TIGR03437 family)
MLHVASFHQASAEARKRVCSRLFLLIVIALAAGPRRLAAQSARVEVTWIGQACFLLQEVGSDFVGPRVITDPPNAAQGYDLPTVDAHVVTISHNHGDHNNSAGIRGNFTLVDGRPITSRTEVSTVGMNFVMIPGFHDNTSGTQRGPNTIVRWTQGGIRFAHFGDYGQDRLSDTQLADLGPVDVIFAPAGGFFTIDIVGVDALVNQVRPKVVILMHYRTGLGGSAQTAQFFNFDLVRAFPLIRYMPAKVPLNPAQLPTLTEYWIMEVNAPMAAVNSAGFAAGQPVAPGSLVSLFGSFAGSGTSSATSTPLPQQLSGTEVLVNGSAVPLLYVSPQQVNAQIPAATVSGQYPVEVRVAGLRVSRGPVSVLSRAPGLFTALNQDGRLNSPSNPARRGEVLQLFATGQGVPPSVPDGASAPITPLIEVPTPFVTIGDRRASVQFSGLAPTLVGVWQINVVIPSDAPVGTSIPVQILSSASSSPLSVAVQ